MFFPEHRRPETWHSPEDRFFSFDGWMFWLLMSCRSSVIFLGNSLSIRCINFLRFRIHRPLSFSGDWFQMAPHYLLEKGSSVFTESADSKTSPVSWEGLTRNPHLMLCLPQTLGGSAFFHLGCNTPQRQGLNLGPVDGGTASAEVRVTR